MQRVGIAKASLGIVGIGFNAFPSWYDKSTVALLRRMTVLPDKAQQENINDLIVGLKDKGIWDRFSAFWVPAAHSQQASLLEWKGVTGDFSSLINSPSFVPFKGWIVEQANQNVSVLGNSLAWNLYPPFQVSQNSFGSWSFGDYGSNIAGCMRSDSATNESFCLIYPRYTNNRALAYNCLPGFSSTGADVPTPVGLTVSNRLEQNSAVWKNGVIAGVVSESAYTELPPKGIRLLGGYGAPAKGSVSFGFFGGSLTEQQHVDLYELLYTYMRRIGNVDLDPSTEALLARMDVVPDAAQVKNIDKLIKDLKAGGVWDKLGILHVLAAHDSQAARLNWKENTFNVSEVNSPIFTPMKGFTGKIGSYLRVTANDVPFNTVPGYTRDDCHLSSWEFASLSGNAPAIGYSQAGAGTARAMIYGRNSGGSANVWLNENVGTGASVVDSIGLTLGTRSLGSDNVRTYKNGQPLGSYNAPTTGDAMGILYLARDGNGVNSSQRSMSFASIGAGLTAAEVLSLYNALNTYMTAIGNV